MCVYRKTKKPETVSVTFKNEKNWGNANHHVGYMQHSMLLDYTIICSVKKKLILNHLTFYAPEFSSIENYYTKNFFFLHLLLCEFLKI